MTDRIALALTLYGESRGEPLIGKLAVASVLRNRLATGKWGKTYAAVCLAPKQFSCWNSDDPNAPKLQALGDQLGSGLMPNDAALRTCLWVADGLLVNAFDSNVDDATHYFAVSMPDPPAWARTGEYVVRIGGHLFFHKVK